MAFYMFTATVESRATQICDQGSSVVEPAKTGLPAPMGETPAAPTQTGRGPIGGSGHTSCRPSIGSIRVNVTPRTDRNEVTGRAENRRHHGVKLLKAG